MRRITVAFGPPAAKVPAQLMKMAHGGRFKGGREIMTVVAASAEATISAGGNRELINFRCTDGFHTCVVLSLRVCPFGIPTISAGFRLTHQHPGEYLR